MADSSNIKLVDAPMALDRSAGGWLMRLVIDSELRTGHARCATLTPSLFVDDERGYGQVIGDGAVGVELIADANRAVQACPERAI
jgi:ferredoxin